MREHILISRVTSCLTLVIFLASTFTSPPAFALESPVATSAPFSKEFPLDLALVKVPAEFGKIEEFYNAAKVVGAPLAGARSEGQEKGTDKNSLSVPFSRSLVILIQDAHEIPDAQKNIQRLIDHFQKHYGVNLIGLEGANARLDPQIFKSFPDKEILKKVFKGYQEQGELAAGTGAAIFSAGSGEYEGVEDWDLYEKGIGFYLQAMQKDPQVSEKLKTWADRLEGEKKKIYSLELLEIDQALESFYRNQGALIQTLQKLAAVKPPLEDSELALILKESKTQAGEESLEIEVKQVALKIETFLKTQTTTVEGKKKWAEFNTQYQEFRTSRMTAKAFAVFLKKLTVRDHLPFRISKALSGSMREQKRMEQVKGTKLFEDFEHYADEVKTSLIQNEKQRKLGQESRDLRLMERLAKLELSREDWNEIKTSVGAPLAGARSAGQAQGLPLQLFSSHLAFYHNAEKRDGAMFEKLMQLMSSSGLTAGSFEMDSRFRGNDKNTAILVAGGFHTEGLTKRLKEKGISYLRLMPTIESIPEDIHYRAHMRGEVSWKKYLQPENGRINLYKAFVRGARDRLLNVGAPLVGARTEGRGQAPPLQSDPRLLKQWRDQIILDLANQNKIEKAGEYTRFIDELNEGKKNENLKAEWMANIDRFLDGLRGLKSRNELNRENVLNLLNLSKVPSWVNGQVLVHHGTLPPTDKLASAFSPIQVGLGIPVKEIAQEKQPAAAIKASSSMGAISSAESGAPVRSEARATTSSEKVIPGFNAGQSKEVGESVRWMIRAASLKDPFLESVVLSGNEEKRAEQIARRISPMRFPGVWKKVFRDISALFGNWLNARSRGYIARPMAVVVFIAAIPFWTLGIAIFFTLTRAFAGAIIHPAFKGSPAHTFIHPAIVKSLVTLRHATIHETAHELGFIDDADTFAFLKFLQSQNIPFNRESITRALPFPAILEGYRIAEEHDFSDAMEKTGDVGGIIFKQNSKAESNWIMSHLSVASRAEMKRFFPLVQLLLPLLRLFVGKEDYDRPLVRLGVILAYVESLKKPENDSERYAYVKFLLTLTSEDFPEILKDAIISGEVTQKSRYAGELKEITQDQRYAKAIRLAKAVYHHYRKTKGAKPDGETRHGRSEARMEKEVGEQERSEFNDWMEKSGGEIEYHSSVESFGRFLEQYQQGTGKNLSKAGLLSIYTEYANSLERLPVPGNEKLLDEVLKIFERLNPQPMNQKWILLAAGVSGAVAALPVFLIPGLGQGLSLLYIASAVFFGYGGRRFYQNWKASRTHERQFLELRGLAEQAPLYVRQLFGLQPPPAETDYPIFAASIAQALRKNRTVIQKGILEMEHYLKLTVEELGPQGAEKDSQATIKWNGNVWAMEAVVERAMSLQGLFKPNAAQKIKIFSLIRKEIAADVKKAGQEERDRENKEKLQNPQKSDQKIARPPNTKRRPETVLLPIEEFSREAAIVLALIRQHDALTVAAILNAFFMAQADSEVNLSIDLETKQKKIQSQLAEKGIDVNEKSGKNLRRLQFLKDYARSFENPPNQPPASPGNETRPGRSEARAQKPGIAQVLLFPQTAEEIQRLKKMTKDLNGKFGKWSRSRGHELFQEALEELVGYLKTVTKKSDQWDKPMDKFLHYFFHGPEDIAAFRLVLERLQNQPAETRAEMARFFTKPEHDLSLIYNAIENFLKGRDSLQALSTFNLISLLWKDDKESLKILSDIFRPLSQMPPAGAAKTLENFQKVQKSLENISKWDFVNRFPGANGIRTARGIDSDTSDEAYKTGEIQIPQMIYFSPMPGYAQNFGRTVVLMDVPVEAIRHSGWVVMGAGKYGYEPEVGVKGIARALKTFKLEDNLDDFLEWQRFQKAQQTLLKKTPGFEKLDFSQENRVGPNIKKNEMNLFLKIMIAEFSKLAGDQTLGIYQSPIHRALKALIQRTVAQTKSYEKAIKSLRQAIDQAADLGAVQIADFFDSYGRRSEVRTPEANLPSLPQEIGMRRMSKEKTEADSKDEKTKNAFLKDLLFLEANYGFLNGEDPVVDWLRKRLRMLLPDMAEADLPVVQVLASTGEGINAMAFSNWTIVLTPELIREFRNEEEADFVLLHELNHLQKEHFTAMEKSKSLGESLGLQRFHEYQADLAAFFQMADKKRNSNPRGAIAFLERLREISRKNNQEIEWDPAHGDISDRILNMRTVVRRWPLPQFEKRMVSLDPGFGASLKDLPAGSRLLRLLAKPPENNSEWNRQVSDLDLILGEAAARKDFLLLQSALGLLYGQVKEYRSKPGGFGKDIKTLTGMKAAWYESVFKQVYQQWDKIFQERYSDIPSIDQILLRGILLQAGGRVPLFEEEETNRIRDFKLNGIRDAFYKTLDRITIFDRIPPLLQRLKKEKISLETDLLFKLASAVMKRALVENAVFDNEKGEIDTAAYLEKSAEMIQAFKEAALATGFSGSGQAWTFQEAWMDVVLYGVYMLADLKQWEASGPGYGAIAAQALKDFRVDKRKAVLFADRYPAGESKNNKAVRKFMQDQWGVSGGVQEMLAELAAIHNKLKYVESEKQEEFVYKNSETSDALIRAAELIRSMPDILDGKIIMTLFGDSPIAGAVNSKSQLPKEEFILRLSQRILFDSDFHFPRMLGGIRWLQLVLTDDAHYQHIIELILEQLWIKKLSLLELNQMTEAVMHPEAAFGMTPGISQTKVDPHHFHSWQLEAMRGLTNQIKAADTDSFFKILEEFLQTWPVPSAYWAGQIWEEVSLTSDEILKAGIELLRGKMNVKDTQTLEQFLTLSFFVRDPIIYRPLQEYLFYRLAENLDFEQSLKLVFERYALQGFGGGPAVLKLLEQKAQTPPRLEALKDAGREFFSKMLNPMESAGTGVMAEGAMAYLLKSEDYVKLLLAILTTEQDESRLKELLGGLWWRFFGTAVQREILEGLESVEGPKSLEAWWQAPIDMIENKIYEKAQGVEPYISAEMFRQSVYRLGLLERHALLRKLLGGSLKTPENREEILQTFFSVYVQPGKEAKVAELLKQVLSAVFEVAPEDLLHLVLEQLFAPRMGNIPAQPGTWDKEADEFTRRQIPRNMINGNLSEKLATKLEGLNPEKAEKITQKIEAAVRDKMLYAMTGVRPGQLPEPDPAEQMLEIIEPGFKVKKAGSFTPVEMVIEVAQQLGAPGIRFLQLLGYFVNIPDQYWDQFVNVYDQIQGQSEETFWEALKQYDPGYAARVVRIGKRLGGGSLYTVFEVELKDEKTGGVVTEAVRVLNPQAGEHARDSLSVMRAAIQKLAQDYPETGFEKALPLLDLLEKWIQKELEDPAYPKEDADFHDRWNGKRKLENWPDQQIVIPKSFESKSPVHLRREEYVPARNLTRYLEKPFEQLPAEDQVELKKAVAFGAQFYLAQIQAGQALSDISPGNMALDEKGAFVVYDRGMYLKFNDQEKLFLAMMASPDLDLQNRLKLFVGWLWSQEENKEKVSSKNQDAVIQALAEQFDSVKHPENANKSPEELIVSMIQEVSGQGLEVPLKFQLLVKNLNVWRRLALHVKFDSLQSALSFYPIAPEAAAKSEVRALEEIARPLAAKFAPASISKLKIEINEDAIVNVLMQPELEMNKIHDVLEAQVNAWLKAIEEESRKEGQPPLLGMAVIRIFTQHLLKVLKSDANSDKKIDLSVLLSMNTDKAKSTELANILPQFTDQLGRVIVVTQSNKLVGHDFLALLKTNKVLFTVLTQLGLLKLNGATLTAQAVLPVLGEGNPLADFNGFDRFFFGVGVEGVSDPLLNVAESVLQVVTAVLVASRVKNPEDLKNSDEMELLKADLLKEMFKDLSAGYDPSIMDFENGNFMVDRGVLRLFLLQLQTQEQAAAAAKASA